MFFYWDRWNRFHATRHGVSKEEAVYVIVHATAPDPINIGDQKLRVWGATPAGQLVQAIYIKIPADRIDYEELEFEDIVNFEAASEPYGYIIHVRELTRDEKRLYHRRRL